jgi:hypothetical protein
MAVMTAAAESAATLTLGFRRLATGRAFAGFHKTLGLVKGLFVGCKHKRNATCTTLYGFIALCRHRPISGFVLYIQIIHDVGDGFIPFPVESTDRVEFIEELLWQSRCEARAAQKRSVQIVREHSSSTATKQMPYRMSLQ